MIWSTQSEEEKRKNKKTLRFSSEIQSLPSSFPIKPSGFTSSSSVRSTKMVLCWANEPKSSNKIIGHRYRRPFDVAKIEIGRFFFANNIAAVRIIAIENVWISFKVQVRWHIVKLQISNSLWRTWWFRNEEKKIFFFFERIQWTKEKLLFRIRSKVCSLWDRKHAASNRYRMTNQATRNQRVAIIFTKKWSLKFGSMWLNFGCWKMATMKVMKGQKIETKQKRNVCVCVCATLLKAWPCNLISVVRWMHFFVKSRRKWCSDI